MNYLLPHYPVITIALFLERSQFNSKYFLVQRPTKQIHMYVCMYACCKYILFPKILAAVHNRYCTTNLHYTENYYWLLGNRLTKLPDPWLSSAITCIQKHKWYLVLILGLCQFDMPCLYMPLQEFVWRCC